MKKAVIITLILIIAVSACKEYQPTENWPDPNIMDFQTTDDLKKFESKQELMTFLDSIQGYNNNYYDGFGRNVMVEEMAVMAESADAGMGAKAAPSGGTDDFSTTNIQVEGVDEADFIKNDGKYIYLVTNNKLVIIDAFPAEDSEIIYEEDFEGNPSNLYVNGDKLVLFTNENNQIYIFPEYEIMPHPVYKQMTRAIVYDISDKKDPEIKYDFEVKGWYVTSRMIGDHVYLVSQDNVYYRNKVIDMPVIMESGQRLLAPDVYYFDNPETNYNFNTVMSFNIDTGKVDAKTFMMGYSNTIYVSQGNMYITYQKNLPYRYYQLHNEDRFYDVVLPLLPSSMQSEISQIKNSDLSEFETWDRISVVIENMYNNMDEDAKEDLIEEIDEAIIEYEIKLEEERRRTVIHKIGIDDGEITYEKRGEVKGYLLNQFSMDEFENKLRVSTTFNSWTRGESIQYNNVYVFDEDLDQIGELERIAPDEEIYSTRFIGDRLYMVTFRNVDPFFVIDLSQDDPDILGELKIPGFSDYLHPYDEDHIIGIGKGTKESEWGGIVTKGVKLALFDVSDINNPRQVDKFEIGERGSDSEALRDHKAFLFDKEKNLLVVPVRANYQYDSSYPYKRRTWQGAYVFTITDEGFELQGKITHLDNYDNGYNYEKIVKRSLYMDNVLYTVSLSEINMNDLDDDLNLIKVIDLPSAYIRPHPVYYDDVAVRGDMAESATVAVEPMPVEIDT